MKQGYDKIPIRTVDTGVVVLAVTSPNCGLHLVFGRTSDIYRPTRWPAHRCVTLPMFHAFTGVMFWKQGQTDCMWSAE